MPKNQGLWRRMTDKAGNIPVFVISGCHIESVAKASPHVEFENPSH